MEELDDLMHYAVSLEFNAPPKQGDAALLGIAFANATFCKKAYSLFKNNFIDQKISAAIEVKEVTLDILLQNDKGQLIFKANLNYDKRYLEEFLKTWPPGQQIAFIFGAKQNHRFYIINPEAIEKDFKPFLLTEYQLVN
ncbi:hypothetical protein [Mucilaginibacter sp. SJ]|uniref:hypothetical protein n=1 Tax=Mucilaginibacter sp. SJ TaxID=3029053 RepID=UPI0023A97617|nr:hypothetical protein [Mucilaginibacter sp. SJ]WEA00707.1 hypothetical protein MusilaSJ_24955 [Mucilaginibacter sp. SJ]